MSESSTFNTFIKALPNIDTDDPEFRALIGEQELTPEDTISESHDYNNGAFVNEAEFLKRFTRGKVAGLSLEDSVGDELNLLINAFIDLPRFTEFEDDETYRARFKAIAVQGAISRRTVRSAILSAVNLFMVEGSSVSLVEREGNEFTVRAMNLEAAEGLVIDQDAIDQGFVSGLATEIPNNVLIQIIDRIRAAGVVSNVVFGTQGQLEFDSAAYVTE